MELVDDSMVSRSGVLEEGNRKLKRENQRVSNAAIKRESIPG